MSTTELPTVTTAKRGKPKEASRGAAVRRAKINLGNAIDERLHLDVEAMELRMLAGIIGCDWSEVPGRLDRATLGELEEWTAAVAKEGMCK